MTTNRRSFATPKTVNQAAIVSRQKQTPKYHSIIERRMQEDSARQKHEGPMQNSYDNFASSHQYFLSQQNFTNSINHHTMPIVNSALITQQNVHDGRLVGHMDTKSGHYKSPDLLNSTLSSSGPLSGQTPKVFFEKLKEIINVAKQPMQQGLELQKRQSMPEKSVYHTDSVISHGHSSEFQLVSPITQQETGAKHIIPRISLNQELVGPPKLPATPHANTNATNTNIASSHTDVVSPQPSSKKPTPAESHNIQHVNGKFKRKSYPEKYEPAFKERRRSSLGSMPIANNRPQLKRRHYSDATPGFIEESYYKRFRTGSGPDHIHFAAPPQRALWFNDGRHSPTFVSETPFTLETLSREIRDECQKDLQSPEVLGKKMKLRSALESIFRTSFPGCSLHLVGSSTSGLGNNESDADFCLMLTQWREIDQRFEARGILMRLNYMLQSCEFVKGSHVIFATVPIVKFVDAVSNCECDININNHAGIRNTHLLRAYCSVDNRVQPLIVVVKKWAKKHGINDAKEGTLSSYALALMVINFLQCGCKPAVIPSLQIVCRDLFTDSCDVTVLLEEDTERLIQQRSFLRSSNIQSLGELLVGFFQYYANDVKWVMETISVRQGYRVPRDSNWRKKFLYIDMEEPFDGNNVAKTVYNVTNFDRIKMKISLAANTLKVSPSLQSIL